MPKTNFLLAFEGNSEASAHLLDIMTGNKNIISSAYDS